MSKRNRSRTRTPVYPKARRLLFESLESRRLLSGNAAQIVASLVARMTPNPQPSGDQPADISQLVPLANFTPMPAFPETGDPVIDQYVVAMQQILATIESTPADRPAFWGESVPASANAYRVHLDDNGMNVRTWAVDWGDGSSVQYVSSQPWVIHQYPDAGQYTILVSANSPDGTFAAAPTLGRFANAVGIGGSGSSGLQVNVANVPPVLHVADAQTVAQGQTFALDNLAAFSYANAAALTVTDGVTNDFTYTLDWGDGSPAFSGTNVDVISAGSTSLPFLGALRSDTPDGPLAHVYSQPGTYYLEVTVTANGSGLSDAQTIPVNVVAITPVITGLPGGTSYEGDTINLSASVAENPADPVAYQWEIDDSSGNSVLQSSDQNASYTFTSPDTYTVSLVAAVDAVTSAPATAAITVNRRDKDRL